MFWKMGWTVRMVALKLRVILITTGVKLRLFERQATAPLPTNENAH